MLPSRRPQVPNTALTTTPPPTPDSGSLNSSPTAPPKAALVETVDTLTPPASPIRVRHPSSSVSRSPLTSRSADRKRPSASYDDDADALASRSGKHYQHKTQSSTDGDDVPICPFEVDLLQDSREEVLGYGAWSVVQKCRCRATTPAQPVVVAVKRPARMDAKPILESEAKILTYLCRRQDECSNAHVARFYGVVALGTDRDPDRALGPLLVLEALPLSLEDYIKRQAEVARRTLTTWNMSQPVIGSCAVWLSLAESVIGSLVWLHDVAGVVHGDIKPANLMLKRGRPAYAADDDGAGEEDDTSFPFQPVFIDFSSSHRLAPDADGAHTPPLNTLSAVTREYTAPELLVSSVLRDPRATATRPSDVFSLAVTLLVAATGNTIVYSGSVFQRQAMATRGWQVLDFARAGGGGMGDAGARVPRHGIVDRALDRAVLKADYDPSNVHGHGGTGLGARISAAAWLQHVQQMRRRGEGGGGDPVKANA